MASEKENAEIFRQMQNEASAMKAREEKLRSIEDALDVLKALLERRERIAGEAGSGHRAAEELNILNRQRTEDIDEKQQLSTTKQLIRLRKSRETLRLSFEEDEAKLVNRLIQVEKARQLAETAVTSHRGNKSTSSVDDRVVSALERMDERLRERHRKQENSIRKRPVRRSNSPLSTLVVQDTSAPVKRPVRRTTKTRVPKLRPPGQVSSDLSLVRKSIESIRRSWEVDIGSFRSNIQQIENDDELPVSCDFIARESRDALSVLERKRAVLAALKLKPNPKIFSSR